MGTALCCLIAFVGPARAFDNLTDAQNLVYATAHLSNTAAGQQITYRYHGWVAGGEDIEDSATLSIPGTGTCTPTR